MKWETLYVIYHMPSTMKMGPTEHGRPHSLYAKYYKTYGGALRTATKWNNEWMAGGRFKGPGPYGVASSEDYNTRVVKMVEKTNIMSGKKYMEASNTPGFCSPSSERYWEM